MDITIRIHNSWSTAVPHALARVLAGLAALEQPRQPGDDAEDLALLLDGIDTPELAPAPAALPAATPRPLPPAGREPDRPRAPFDGTPATGRSLYRWACDHKALPRVNAIGKSFNYPRRVTDWEPSQVAAAYAILTSEPAANGKAC